MFTFPTALDDPQRLIGLLGSYWPSTYGGADLVISYCQAGNAAEKQLFQNMSELQESISRYSCPVFNTQLWYAVTFNKSAEIVSGLTRTYPIPNNFKDAHYAANAILTPSAIFTQGIDFLINTTNSQINFVGSLFSDPRIVPTPVIVNGVITDYTVTLWFFRAQLDNQWLYEQFGYIIPLNLPSSRRYRDAINAILSSYTSATSYDNVAQLLEAIADAPRVLTDGETVQVITHDAASLLVATDRNIYRFSSAANPIVIIGQVVNQGDQLTDTVAIYESSTGQMPPISSIAIGPGFLDSSISGPLVFSNASTPLVVTLNVAGFTKVSWSLGGAPADVTQFFNLLHSKGIAAGKTLAMCMDNRPQPQPTQPTAFNLPATINPMQFLYQNVFRANAFTIVLKAAGFGPEALGINLIPQLRDMVPPHSTAIVVIM